MQQVAQDIDPDVLPVAPVRAQFSTQRHAATSVPGVFYGTWFGGTAAGGGSLVDTRYQHRLSSNWRSLSLLLISDGL